MVVGGYGSLCLALDGGGTEGLCKPNWIDKDGNEKRGKTVILDLDAVASTSAAIKLLETVLTAVKER